MEKFKPKIILSAAISLDGKIATVTGESNLSSKKDQTRLHKLRSQVDAILIGKNTVVRDDPLLTVRFSKGKNPTRIILDSRGIISEKSKILQTSHKVKTIIVVSKKISNKNLQKLKNFPIEIIKVGENEVDVKLLTKILGSRKIKSILLEGGGTINWEFIKNNLVDEFFITLTPFILGGKNAISLVQGEGFEKISESSNLRLKRIRRQENELVLNYTKL
jgi:2,5-diamino-6-(ribosylamino)-4(3H)-pyrimidinone 5'-phosphate reductase